MRSCPIAAANQERQNLQVYVHVCYVISTEMSDTVCCMLVCMHVLCVYVCVCV